MTLCLSLAPSPYIYIYKHIYAYVYVYENGSKTLEDNHRDVPQLLVVKVFQQKGVVRPVSSKTGKAFGKIGILPKCEIHPPFQIG